MKNQIFTLLLCSCSYSHAATTTIDNLDALTATHTITSKGTIANSVFTDTSVNDGDANVDDNADITLAWEMTLLKTTPSPTGTRRSIVDLGGGTNGLSVTWYNGTIFAQVQQSPSQVGGSGLGDTGALSYAVTSGDLNIERSWVISLDVDGASSTMNMFVDGTLIGSVSGVPVTDWAGGDSGGFFARSGSVLVEDFNSGSGAIGPIDAEASANLTSGFRLYEDTFVTIPEPTSVSLLTLGVFALIARRKK
ncbi:PEP-CTERM sorting domain-containing protein [Verrucomicrobiaceae bacterium N1E253]|uniref:PEP-CTERM sorting domain-containing protein n=1 Tax=Oceaniferula marina TaxID=2748318 RepID=A0A851GEH6_9BACT|nr:PEP-CTERM sorting domain-containing protein [Oceaniferula marina]NWK56158.1 PEP-CTERM sorting domain-containing protein [Oceaniferula marina]